MKLLDLDPEIKYREEPFQMAVLYYDCPECARHGKSHRTINHLHLDGQEEQRPSWGFSGTSFKDFSLTGTPNCGARSTRVLGGCKGHWDIVNGEIIFHGDSGQ